MSREHDFVMALAFERVGHTAHAKFYKSEADRLARGLIESPRMTPPGEGLRCGECGQLWGDCQAHAKEVSALVQAQSRAHTALGDALRAADSQASIAALNRLSAAMNEAFTRSRTIISEVNR